jgi:hypothetical protein
VLVLSRTTRSRTVSAGRRRHLLAPLLGVAALVVLASGCITNGAWSATPAPVTPVQELGTVLDDVSCVTDDWCLAVGSMGLYPLAEVWDGSAWSVVTAPSLGGESDTEPASVACGTSTSCVAKVVRSMSTPDVYDSVVAWDGEQWHELAGAEGPYVDPLPYACATDGTCLIVDNRGEETLIWDGDSVTRIPFTVTRPAWDVNAIDCLAADECIAATSLSLAVWDGTTWSELAGSDSSSLFVDGAHTISCVAADDCLAVGPNAAETGPTSARWDGSAWTEVALPAGVSATGALECLGPTECLLPVSVGGPGMLAWTGSEWLQAPAAPAGITGLSCLPLWCLGVGATGSPATPTAATYAWTNP